MLRVSNAPVNTPLKCEDFKKLPQSERWQLVKSLHWCYNCFKAFKSGHASSSCSSHFTCRASGCSQKHHTILHDYFVPAKADGDKKIPEKEETGKKDEGENEEKSAKDLLLQVLKGGTGEKKDVSVPTSKHCGLVKSRPKDVYLQVVPVRLCFSEEVPRVRLQGGTNSVTSMAREVISMAE